uniref:Uncharacterized protein n=1 Tax=Oryza rufipogon TaxID=4529 RepID=A0A0E0MUV2_ORYRU
MYISPKKVRSSAVSTHALSALRINRVRHEDSACSDRTAALPAAGCLCLLNPDAPGFRLRLRN